MGLGFHAQMTHDEAIAFSTRREQELSKSAERLTDRASELKARIKLVMGAIDELVSAAGER